MSNEVRHLATEQLSKSFHIQDFSHPFEVTNNVRIQDFSRTFEVTEKMRSDRERQSDILFVLSSVPNMSRRSPLLCPVGPSPMSCRTPPQYVMSNEVRHLATEQLPQSFHIQDFSRTFEVTFFSSCRSLPNVLSNASNMSCRTK